MRGTGIAPASVVKWAALLALMSILLFACGQKPEPPEEPEEEPAIVVEEPEPEPEPEPVYPYVFPLTGIGTEEKIEHRPIVVFVENSPRARPQSGLDQADIVFELLAEGDITRFVAVFQSEASGGDRACS